MEWGDWHIPVLIVLAMGCSGMGGYILGRFRCRKCEAKWYQNMFEKDQQ